jgi:hypothetical protein
MQQGYYSSQPRSNLPVDPERVDTRGLAQNTPFLGQDFQRDLGGIGDFIIPLIDALVVDLQNNAGKNALRTFAFNLWSQSGYVNPAFANLVRTFAAHVEAIAIPFGSSANIDGPDGIIAGEAPRIVKMASSFLAKENPEVLSYLPVEAEAPIMQEAGQWASLVRNLNMSNGAGATGYGRGGGMAGQRGSAGIGLNGRRDAGGARSYDDIRPSWEKNNQTPYQAPAVRVGLNKPPQAAAPPAPVQEQAHSGYSTLKRVLAGEDLPTIRAQAQQSRQAPAATQTQPKGKPLHHIPIGDGRWLCAAVIAPSKPSYGPLLPPSVYDRETHVLFYVFNTEGTAVGEYVMDKESLQAEGYDVNYLEHELKEALKKQFRSNQDVYSRELKGAPMTQIRALMPAERGVVAVQPTKERREELNEMATAPRQIVKPIQDASLERCAFKATIERDREQVETDVFLEYQAEITNDQYVFSMGLKHMLEIGRTTNLTEFAEVIDRLYRTEETFTTEMYEAVNKRMTTAFNRMLKKQFFMDTSIDSFFEDYPDFPRYMADKYGDMLVEKVEAQAPFLIRRATSVLQGEALSTYIHQNIPEDVRDKYPEPAVFCERYSVTQVPWTIHEINKVWRLEGLVSQTHAKALHSVLLSIFARTMTNGCDEHVIWTADGSRIYAYRSPIDDDNFVITTDSPDFIATIEEHRFDI